VTISTKPLRNAWSVSTGVAPNMPRSGSAIFVCWNALSNPSCDKRCQIARLSDCAIES
jgi:hypothetical protein